MHKTFLLAATFLASSVSAQAQTTHSLADDAAAFGSRESVSEPALSPDGNEILYLSAGPGRSTVAVVSNLTTGATKAVTQSAGASEQLRWCKYVSATRAVCRVSALNDDGNNIIGSARLVAIDLDGRNVKLLGQSKSAYDAYIRQYDGDVVDWMDGTSGFVLMRTLMAGRG